MKNALMDLQLKNARFNGIAMAIYAFMWICRIGKGGKIMRN